MKKQIAYLILLALVFFNTNNLSSQTLKTPAFPGAEGGGMYATGGRGGKTLIVNSLADDGSPGTLRWAIEQKGARTIVFNVSGIIELQSVLKIKNGDLTIAGQSAPGDGITIRDYQTEISAENVIIRFLRFRLGNKFPSNSGDGFSGTKNKNVIIDHCTMSWSVDECSSFYDNEDFTLQWCIISESLNSAGHTKGKHGYGGIWGGKNASFHHNLLAHHTSRNPRFNGWKRTGLRYRATLDEEKVDFRNNVIYNWGDNSSYGGEAAGKYNIVNNYFKFGPGTKETLKFRITQIDNDTTSTIYPSHGKYYIKGNFVWGNKEVTTNNWLGVNLAEGITMETCKVETPYTLTTIYTQTAEEAFASVLKHSGASYKRDRIDTRICDEVRTGTTTFYGSITKRAGIIDKPEDVGGYPIHNPGSKIKDDNKDGIPDQWLSDNYKGKTAIEINPEGYSYLELYLNGLIEKHNK